VVSRLALQTLETIARGSGGQAFQITPQDTSLSRLAAAIEGMEQKALAREYSYRRKERFQLPLAAGLASLAAGLLVPLPSLRKAKAGASPAARAAALLLALMLLASSATAQQVAPSVPPAAAPNKAAPSTMDEVLLRPRRATREGRDQYQRGNHPEALAAFERAAKARPRDPAVRFNMADALYKNGRYDEAATLFRSLAGDARAPLAGSSRFNLGNSLYQKQDYRGAVQAYREALRGAPGDADVRRNLELALQALREQQEQEKRRQQQDQNKQDQDKQRQDQQQKQDQQQPKDRQDQKQQQSRPGEPKPQTPQQREDERFRQEAGMPKERAMQLLEALQQNEKAEQKKLLALKRAQKKKGRDW
jgi:tetratricopeptide (TPR) repeat protein